MILSQIALDHAPGQIGSDKSDGIDFTFPWRTQPSSGRSGLPTALVASSDKNLLQQIAEMVLQCGIPTWLALTVSESKRILERQAVSLVVCDDRLIDGEYEDILSETALLQLTTPVIVVSSTADWPDYLRAINAGAFDYLAYPPIPGDLPQTIHEALTTLTARDFHSAKSKSFRQKEKCYESQTHGGSIGR